MLTISVTILSSLFLFLIYTVIKDKGTISALKSEKLSLEKKISDLEIAIAKNKPIIDRETILTGYIFDDKFGTYRSKFEPFFYICNKCINHDIPKVNRLKAGKRFYCCTACDTYYYTQEQLNSGYRSPKNLY